MAINWAFWRKQDWATAAEVAKLRETIDEALAILSSRRITALARDLRAATENVEAYRETVRTVDTQAAELRGRVEKLERLTAGPTPTPEERYYQAVATARQTVRAAKQAKGKAA